MGILKSIKQFGVQAKLMKNYIIPIKTELIMAMSGPSHSRYTGSDDELCLNIIVKKYVIVMQEQGVDTADIFLDIMYEDDPCVKKYVRSSPYSRLRNVSINDFKKFITDTVVQVKC